MNTSSRHCRAIVAKRNQSVILFQVQLFVFLCLVALVHSGLLADERPNIIFLMADDQCTYSMGCYDTPGAQTPNLDQLARDGMIFDRHYDTTAICMASRASVMTGLFEYRHGCNFDSGPMLREVWEKSYPQQLRRAGYQCAFAGKFGFEVLDVSAEEASSPAGSNPVRDSGAGRSGAGRSGAGRSSAGRSGAVKRLPVEDFDRWGGGPGQTSYKTSQNQSMKAYAKEFPHSTLSYGAFGRDFVADAAKKDEPFCLSISFKAPHQPVTPDPQFDGIYEAIKLKTPANYGRQYSEHFSAQSKQGRQYERFESWGYADDYEKTMKLYYQQIYAIDVAVGMIRKAVEQAGVTENTVIIYTSDNGFLCGSHGYGSKVLPYEEASRVPLIVFDPRHPSSGKTMRCDALTGNVDFAPTIQELAGLPVDETLDGRSLLPLLDNPKAQIHEQLPLINVWGPKQVHSLGVVTRQFKLIYWPFGEREFKPTMELYDMQSDRLELTNLAVEVQQEDASSRAMMQEALVGFNKVLEGWQHAAVPYNGYERFGKIFDPEVDWTAKQQLYSR